MVSEVHLRLNASDRSYFSLLKKEVHALAEQAGFTAHRVGEIDIVVAELVSNLSKHAGGGELFVKLIEEGGLQGIEIISADGGPGIADVRAMMQDGVSTKNTLGHGLGSIRRLSDFFQVYTLKGWGSLFLARLFAKRRHTTKKKPVTEVRSLVVPKPGEVACGDGFHYQQTDGHLRLFLGDGLGHGQDAAFAVQKAIEAFTACQENSPVDILRHIHQSVKKTRGLVATVAIFSFEEKTWKICGVGNITSKFFGTGMSKNHSPYNGIVGLNMPNTLNDQVVAYEPGQLLLMCSDGIRSKWDFLRFPGIMRNDLSLLNAALFKDFARNTDDMSIASCKLNV